MCSQAQHVFFAAACRWSWSVQWHISTWLLVNDQIRFYSRIYKIMKVHLQRYENYRKTLMLFHTFMAPQKQLASDIRICSSQCVYVVIFVCLACGIVYIAVNTPLCVCEWLVPTTKKELRHTLFFFQFLVWIIWRESGSVMSQNSYYVWRPDFSSLYICMNVFLQWLLPISMASALITFVSFLLVFIMILKWHQLCRKCRTKNAKLSCLWRVPRKHEVFSNWWTKRSRIDCLCHSKVFRHTAAANKYTAERVR